MVGAEGITPLEKIRAREYVREPRCTDLDSTEKAMIPLDHDFLEFGDARDY